MEGKDTRIETESDAEMPVLMVLPCKRRAWRAKTQDCICKPCYQFHLTYSPVLHIFFQTRKFFSAFVFFFFFPSPFVELQGSDCCCKTVVCPLVSSPLSADHAQPWRHPENRKYVTSHRKTEPRLYGQHATKIS